MNRNEKLPPRTVERLSKCRRLLFKCRDLEEVHIFSHKLADLFTITPEQVRRDLMLIGRSNCHSFATGRYKRYFKFHLSAS